MAFTVEPGIVQHPREASRDFGFLACAIFGPFSHQQPGHTITLRYRWARRVGGLDVSIG